MRGTPERVEVDDAELEPHPLRADRHRLVGELDRLARGLGRGLHRGGELLGGGGGLFEGGGLLLGAQREVAGAAGDLAGGGADVLVDPWLTGNPKAAVAADELPADAILLTHGHGDHLGDTVSIAERTGATVLAIVELAAEIEGAGVEHVVNPNLGGTVQFDWGWVKLVPAWHTAVSPSGTAHTPAGLVINIGGKTIYHLGDTALFSDLALPGQRDRLDYAIVPIGGH